MTLESKIQEIKDAGLKLPIINYEFDKFESLVPFNLSYEGGVHGIEAPDLHDTFEEACDAILEFNNDSSNQ